MAYLEPKYHFGLKTEYGKEKLAIPGPGAYQPEYHLARQAHPQARIGTEKRGKLSEGTKNPGPGSYGVQSALAKKGAKIGTESRSKGPGERSTPGPGVYDLDSSIGRGAMGKTMGAKFYEVEKNTTVGPATYESNINAVKRKAPGISFGISRSDQAGKNVVPGPGAYTVNENKGAPNWRYCSD